MSKNRQMSIQQAQELVDRLERLSADSTFAHQASGIRGALLRRLAVSGSETPGRADPAMSNLVSRGYEILAWAARQIPG